MRKEPWERELEKHDGPGKVTVSAGALRKLAAALRDNTGTQPGERSRVMHSVATSLEEMARGV